MKGLKVTKVDNGSRAYGLGLKPGDVLVNLDGKALVDKESLRHEMSVAESSGKSSCEIEYIREGNICKISSLLGEPLGLSFRPYVLKQYELNESLQNQVIAQTTDNLAVPERGEAFTVENPRIPFVSWVLFLFSFCSIAFGTVQYFFYEATPFGHMWFAACVANAVIWLALGTIVHYLSDIRYFTRAR